MSAMRRWVDSYGDAWECDAYDHGPMCRLCRQVEVSFLNVACPRCKAQPGQKCRRLHVPRKRVSFIHTARGQAFNDYRWGAAGRVEVSQTHQAAE